MIENFGLYLVLYFLILLVSCGSTASENKDNNKNSHQAKEITNLEFDSLSVKNIKAFEQRAIQKLEDLKDYFEIMSDSKIDTTFKNQAIVMACELFSTNQNTITISLDQNQEEIPQIAASFFRSLQNGDMALLSFEIHNISVIKNIKHLNDAEYKGAIKFELFVSPKQENVGKLSQNINMQCDIIAKKVQKEFGKESKQVWEVFLGNIFQVQ